MRYKEIINKVKIFLLQVTKFTKNKNMCQVNDNKIWLCVLIKKNNCFVCCMRSCVFLVKIENVFMFTSCVYNILFYFIFQNKNWDWIGAISFLFFAFRLIYFGWQYKESPKKKRHAKCVRVKSPPPTEFLHVQKFKQTAIKNTRWKKEKNQQTVKNDFITIYRFLYHRCATMCALCGVV